MKLAVAGDGKLRRPVFEYVIARSHKNISKQYKKKKLKTVKFWIAESSAAFSK